jgi:hypothetical protein
LELEKNSFKDLLKIQGVTISSIYVHNNYFPLCTLMIIVYIFRFFLMNRVINAHSSLILIFQYGFDMP